LQNIKLAGISHSNTCTTSEAEITPPSTAQLITGSFMDYAMPRADMLPNFVIALEEVRCKTNPIGVKGIGE
jgi:carbon-monoxide dehydrogenase large subunit